MNEAVGRFWAEACAARGIPPETACEVWYFGHGEPMATALAELVLHGSKRATCGLVDVDPNQATPHVGGYSVVTNVAGEPLVLIRTTEYREMRFDEVDEAFARDEGEGDLSYAHWRRVHWAFFERECAEHGVVMDLSRQLGCERFEKLYPLP